MVRQQGDPKPGLGPSRGTLLNRQRVRKKASKTTTTQKRSSKCCVVGLDFGATFSAVAWAYVNHDDFLNQNTAEFHVNNVRSLRSYNRSPLKGITCTVPSVLLYHDREVYHDGEVNLDREIRWGYEVTAPLPSEASEVADDHVFSFTKHLFHRGRAARLETYCNRKAAEKLGKSLEMVVEDYLRKLHQKAIKELAKAGPREAIYYVVSIPAAWSDIERNSYLKVAARAGFKDPMVVYEPEAAAALLINQPEYTMLPGDVFIVVDLGGLTADLITLGVGEGQSMRHVTISEGERCGSNIINQVYFRRWLMDKLAPKNLDREMFERVFRRVEPQFEMLKKDFEGTYGGRKEELRIEGLQPGEMTRLGESCIPITDRDMLSILNPVVNEIIILIQAQFDMAVEQGQEPKEVLLTGGLSKSEYLFRRVHNAFRKKEISVTRTDVPDAIVAQGSVLCALNKGLIIEQKSRFGLGAGTDADCTWQSNASWCEEIWLKNKGCSKIQLIEWFLKKGDTIGSTYEKTMENRYRTTKASPESHRRHERKMVEEIFYTTSYCRGSGIRAKSKKPRVRRGVHKLGDLEIDLSNLSDDEFVSLWELDEKTQQNRMRYAMTMTLEGVNKDKAKVTVRIPPSGPTRATATFPLGESSLDYQNSGYSQSTRKSRRNLTKSRRPYKMVNPYSTRSQNKLLGSSSPEPGEDAPQNSDDSETQDELLVQASRHLPHPSASSDVDLALPRRRTADDESPTGSVTVDDDDPDPDPDPGSSLLSSEDARSVVELVGPSSSPPPSKPRTLPWT